MGVLTEDSFAKPAIMSRPRLSEMSRVMSKPDLCLCEVTAKLIFAFVFATHKVQFLFFLNPEFQLSSMLVWLYRPICVGPGRKHRIPVFSRRGSNGMADPVSNTRHVITDR